jgi:hypothetical protein
MILASALIYYDQRMRREGYDVDWMMTAAGMNTRPPLQVKENPHAPFRSEGVQG